MHQKDTFMFWMWISDTRTDLALCYTSYVKIHHVLWVERKTYFALVSTRGDMDSENYSLVFRSIGSHLICKINSIMIDNINRYIKVVFISIKAQPCLMVTLLTIFRICIYILFQTCLRSIFVLFFYNLNIIKLLKLQFTLGD